MTAKGIEITEVNIHPIRNKQTDNPLEAFVRIVLNGQFVVNSIKVVNGKFGLFVSYPREFSKKENKGYNFCFPITKGLQEYMSERILNEYRLSVAG